MFRLGFIIALFAVIGAALSALAAWRIYEQDMQAEFAALDRAIESQVVAVRDRLAERELLSQVTVALFRPPPSPQRNALTSLREAIYAFKTDFVAASWIRALTPSDLPLARAVLSEEGVAHITNGDGKAVDIGASNGPANVILDIEPRNPTTTPLLGLDVGTIPIMLDATERALATQRPISADPMRLASGAIGLVLVAAVASGDAGRPAGFMSFSFGLGPLMLANASPLFVVAVKDPRPGLPGELAMNQAGEVSEVPPIVSSGVTATARTVAFGGRNWDLVFYSRQDPTGRIFWTAAVAGLVGLTLTGLICGLFGYVAFNNLRLSREVQSRISFEHRLGAVIGELNHRVKNVLAVIQSIVTRTLRQGLDMDTARELLIGRIHAMSHVVSLLSESEWQGVRLKGLLESRAIPHSERMIATGPDIVVSARAAQSLSLLFFELASHANDSGPFDPDRFSVVVQWMVTGEGKNALFQLRWEEFNTNEATRREETEFGTILLDRVAPEAVGGKSKRYFTAASYVYELTAPLEAVIDRTERDRTGRLANIAERKD